VVDNISKTAQIDNAIYIQNRKTQTETANQPPTPSNADRVNSEPPDILSKNLGNLLARIHSDPQDANSLDLEKISKLKAQLEKGTYQINHEKTAEGLLQDYPITLGSPDNDH
jgi:flagellar biosynthesis anti-sigma factor FlgM